MQRLQDELPANQQVLESAAADVASAAGRTRQRQSEAQNATSGYGSGAQAGTAARAMMDAVNAASGVRNRITQAEERIAALERESERLQSELEAANQQVETFGGQRGQISLEFESAQPKVTSVAARLAETRSQIAEKRGRDRSQKAAGHDALGVRQVAGQAGLARSGD